MKSILEKAYFILAFGEVTGVIPRVVGNFTSTSAAGETSNPALLFFNVLLVVSTLVYAFPYLPRLWAALLQLRWIFLLYMWMTISVFWSILPAMSLRAEIYALVYLLSAGYMALRYNTQELLRKLNWFYLGTALLSIPGQFILSSFDQQVPGWQGVFMHKSILGLNMMLAITLLFIRKESWSSFRWLALALFIMLLTLSQSFTSVVDTVIILLFIFSQRLSGKHKLAAYLVLATLFCLSLLVSDPLSLLLKAGGKDSGFTGRDNLWAYALVGILRRPVAGYGYQAFWGDATDVQNVVHWTMTEAHNGALQVVLDLGLVGLLLTIAMLVNIWRRARRIQRSNQSATGLWMLTLLVATLAHSPMEADLMLVNPFWYLVVVAAFSCLRVEREAMLAVATRGSIHAAGDVELGRDRTLSPAS